MSKKGKPHGPRFAIEAKIEALKLLDRKDVTIEQLSASLGVTTRTIRNWREQVERRGENPLSAAERRRLKRLEAEVERLKLENEILKKARTFSAKRRS